MPFILVSQFEILLNFWSKIILRLRDFSSKIFTPSCQGAVKTGFNFETETLPLLFIFLILFSNAYLCKL